MTPAAMLLLAVSVGCSTARAIYSKKLGSDRNDRCFYRIQALVFAVAAAVIGVVNINDIGCPSPTALFLSFAYGILTVSSQWTYTVALTKAPVSTCAMVYSFGFILPTVLGTVLWSEAVTVLKIISILLCIGTIILTSFQQEKDKLTGLPVSLIIAMLSSGGLGLVQKIQQKSDAYDETGIFLFLAFVLAMLFFLTASVSKRKRPVQKAKADPRLILHILTVGASMALANTANTLLAGLLPSAIVFPIVNVGVILASFTISVTVLKERLNKRQIAAFCFGVTAILLFNL